MSLKGNIRGPIGPSGPGLGVGVPDGTYANPVIVVSGGVITSLTGGVAPGALRINCGGPAVGAFAADKMFSAGYTPYSTAASIDGSLTVNPASPLSVYQTQRYGNGLVYTLTGLLSSHGYTLRLHYAELYYTAGGNRVQKVVANGVTLDSVLDVAANVGINHALSRSSTVTSDGSGVITVTFTAISGDSPIINAIEVF